MAITGLFLEPDSAPYTSTTLNTRPALVDGDKYNNGGTNYWYTHYAYGLDFGVSTTISGLAVYGHTAADTPTTWLAGHDSFNVYKSDDNSTWTFVETFDAPPIIHSAPLEWGFEVVFSTNQTARFFKIIYTDPVTTIGFNSGLSGWIGEIVPHLAEVIIFNFSNPVPTDLAKAYGTTTQLYLTTTVSGPAPSYIYDAVFYDAYNDSIINTASSIQSEQPAGVIMSTPSGIDYQWYVTAISSGTEDTSDTYTFTNKFLCEGQTQINNVPASGIPVRLYRRSTGEYIGGVISSGVSGTFEIETDYNEYHYAIALYTSDDTNAIISDWLTPNN